MNLIFSIPAMQEAPHHCAPAQRPLAGAWPWEQMGPVLRVRGACALFQIGDAVAQQLYLVRYGAFKIRRADLLGGRHLAGVRMQNELLGLDAIGLRHHASAAIALVDSGVVEVDYAQLARYGRSISALLCQAQACAQDWSQIMRTGQADQRMAALILHCARRYADLGFSARSFRLPMSRRDLADLLGLTPESVSRALGHLHTAGLLEIRGTLLSLRDVTGLAQLLGEGKAMQEFAFGAGLPASQS